MRISPGFIKLLLAAALSVASPTQATVLTAKIAKLSTGAGSMLGVRLSLDWPDGAATGSLRLHADTLDFPSLLYRANNIEWQCSLARPQESEWQCAGPLNVAGARGQRLAVDITPMQTLATLGVGTARLSYRKLATAPEHASIALEKVPVAWLKAYLASLWPAGRWTAGQLDGSVEVLSPKAGPFEIRTDLGLDKLSLETPDGLLAAASLKARLRLQYKQQGILRSVDSQATITGGELLFDSFYAVFPQTPVQVHVLAQRSGNASWQLPQIQWQDPGTLSVEGKATLDAKSSVADLDLAVAIANLAVARDRYLSGFLAPAGFSDVQLSGKLDARLQMRAGKLFSMESSFDKVNAVDTKARFTFAGIDGDLRWTRAATALASKLSWQSGALFGIGLGPARYPFTSSKGELRLDKAVTIPALEGRLVLDHLRWQAPDDPAGAKFKFGMSMQSLDLASLSQRLGWPKFTGSIGGRIPSASFQNDILTLDGGLQMNLFGGSINLQDLSMERPFGTAPTLSANVKIQDIDLEPMTQVFGFGSITGRLDGSIDHLRLVDWTPVAFDARLQTDEAWKGKRRISQRAVKDISSVGGSGLVGGLQTQVLKIFKDFGYRRIGIGCKLQDNVCTMDGISSAGDGYIIVEGSGLPRIQVVGFRRKVDWPTLVSRLQAATNGQAPIIK